MARILSTKKEIVGLFYLRHLIEKKFSVQKLEGCHFEEIANAMDEGENTSSKRTVGRLFNFENKVGNRMVKKITEIIKWYYDDRKKNFDNFLEIEKTNIDNFYKVVDFRTGSKDLNETQRKLDNFFEEIEQYFDEKTNKYKFPTEKEKENERALKNLELPPSQKRAVINLLKEDILKKQYFSITLGQSEDKIELYVEIVNDSIKKLETRVVKDSRKDNSLGMFNFTSTYFWLLENRDENTLKKIGDEILKGCTNLINENGEPFKVIQKEESFLIINQSVNFRLEIRSFMGY
jgi:hypothetical protein